MATHPVVGIYSSVARARLAQEALIEEGVPEERIAISIDLTADGVAAEAPGPSYAGRGARGWFGSERRSAAAERRASDGLDAQQGGTCVVTVEARNAAEADRIQEIMTALRAIRIEAPVA